MGTTIRLQEVTARLRNSPPRTTTTVVFTFRFLYGFNKLDTTS